MNRIAEATSASLKAKLRETIAARGRAQASTVSDAITRRRIPQWRSRISGAGVLVDRAFSALGGAVRIANPRGWASVDVQMDGRKFRFATTHLETSDFPAQPLQAFDMIESAGDTALPVVFIGDFNASVGDPLGTYQRFVSAGFADACRGHVRWVEVKFFGSRTSALGQMRSG